MASRPFERRCDFVAIACESGRDTNVDDIAVPQLLGMVAKKCKTFFERHAQVPGFNRASL